MQDGALVAEWYGPEGAPDRTHAVMSISKSVVGCVAARAGRRTPAGPGPPVTDYVPELATSGYAGATVRHVLDMRSGVRSARTTPTRTPTSRRAGEWIGRAPQARRGVASTPGCMQFLARLPRTPHGGRSSTVPPRPTCSGWVCERAAAADGRPDHRRWSGSRWAPSRRRDPLRRARHRGARRGLCATARDLARFGQMLLDGGAVPDERRRRAHGDRIAVAARRRGRSTPTRGRSSLRRLPRCPCPAAGIATSSGSGPASTATCCCAWASTDRLVHVTRRTRTVCVKLSSWPDPAEPRLLAGHAARVRRDRRGARGRPSAVGSHRGNRASSPGASRHGKSDRSGKCSVSTGFAPYAEGRLGFGLRSTHARRAPRRRRGKVEAAGGDYGRT